MLGKVQKLIHDLVHSGRHPDIRGVSYINQPSINGTLLEHILLARDR